MRRLMIVPAAGRGSRLSTDLPKLLVSVGGRAMIDHVLDRHSSLIDEFVIVVSPSATGRVSAHLARRSEAVTLQQQATPTGMLDAILVAADDVARAAPDEVWVTWCDQVGVLPATIARLAEALAPTPPPDLAFPTVPVHEPYIHFARNQSGRIVGVLQRREGAEMPSVGEADIGLFAMPRVTFETHLQRYASEASPGAASLERNFLPFIPWLAACGRVVTVHATDPREAVGVNTPEDLRRVASFLEGGAGR